MTRCSNHSPAREKRTDIISKLETQQGTAGTHILKNRRQVLSVGLKCSKVQLHSLSRGPRTSVISRLEAL